LQHGWDANKTGERSFLKNISLWLNQEMFSTKTATKWSQHGWDVNKTGNIIFEKYFFVA
jgi:hypothetical protein